MSEKKIESKLAQAKWAALALIMTGFLALFIGLASLKELWKYLPTRQKTQLMKIN